MNNSVSRSLNNLLDNKSWKTIIFVFFIPMASPSGENNMLDRVDLEIVGLTK